MHLATQDAKRNLDENGDLSVTYRRLCLDPCRHLTHFCSMYRTFFHVLLRLKARIAAASRVCRPIGSYGGWKKFEPAYNFDTVQKDASLRT